MKSINNRLYDCMLGFAVGDALGVPVEFCSREELKRTPVKDMEEFGTHQQPAGTWSDDTSMTLCTLASLRDNYWEIKPKDIMDRFARWRFDNQYTANGNMFDVGNTCNKAIIAYVYEGCPVQECGYNDICSNGNGSLMRILPLAFSDYSADDIYKVSALTHAHPISKIACSILVLIAKRLLAGDPIERCIENAFLTHLFFKPEYQDIFDPYLDYFEPLLRLTTRREETIRSTGYVVDTLEAALWCVIHSSSYKECVLKAVNLGEDTDTVAAVAGGLAGIIYGHKNIPKKWIKKLANLELIKTLCS